MSVSSSPSRLEGPSANELDLSDLFDSFSNLSLNNLRSSNVSNLLINNESSTSVDISENSLILNNPEKVILVKKMTSSSQQNYPIPPKFDTKLLDVIPKFDGNPLELSSFLDIANTLLTNYWDQDPDNSSCTQNLTLIYGIYSKLIGKAREVYSICVSKDWATVKNALVAHFGDQRDENGLLFDINQLRQSSNDTPLQFLTKIMSNLSALHNFIDTHESDANITTVKKNFYNVHALRIFLAGLKEPLGSTIRAMKPSSLAEARQYIISEDNIRHLQRPNFDHLIKPKQIQQKPNFNFNLSPRPFENPFPKQLPPPQFPRGPINIQPRPVPPQKFPTAKQVFGNQRIPSNVWKPNPHRFQNLPRPTPMSGISQASQSQSQNRFQPRPHYLPNYFKSYRPYNGPIIEEINNHCQDFYNDNNQDFDPNCMYLSDNDFAGNYYENNYDETDCENYYYPEQTDNCLENNSHSQSSQNFDPNVPSTSGVKQITDKSVEHSQNFPEGPLQTKFT